MDPRGADHTKSYSGLNYKVTVKWERGLSYKKCLVQELQEPTVTRPLSGKVILT